MNAGFGELIILALLFLARITDQNYRLQSNDHLGKSSIDVNLAIRIRRAGCQLQPVSSVVRFLSAHLHRLGVLLPTNLTLAVYLGSRRSLSLLSNP